MLLSLVSLALFCHTEGFMGQSLKNFQCIPLVCFLMMSFFYVAGISRNTLLILHQIIECYSLQLLLKNCSVGMVWLFIFGITKVIPDLLDYIGVGYFYCYMILFTTCALVFVIKTVPDDMHFQKLAISKEPSSNGSSCDNNSNVGSTSSETSSINEIKIEKSKKWKKHLELTKIDFRAYILRLKSR